MLKYIKSYLIDKKIYFIFVVVFFTKNLYAENIIARYEVTWNNVSLGNITWWYKIVDSNYEFLIKTEDAGFLSKVYKFSGENISRGIFKNNRFYSKEYYHTWKTKKKNKLIKIFFDKNYVKTLEMVPRQTNTPSLDFYSIDGVTDPVAAALELIINDKKQTVKNVFDGRRIFDITTLGGEQANDSQNPEFSQLKKYELKITNYRNIWKDHNKTELKKIEVITGVLKNSFRIPVSFKIKNSGLVFTVSYLDHKIYK